jgi:hypothetical protein
MRVITITWGFYMGDLSKNFSKSELRCRCGRCDCDGSATSTELIVVLELIRAHFSAIAPGGKAKITINSGHRCPSHNRDVGGSASSRHLAAIAADIVVRQKQHDGLYQRVPTIVVHEWLREMFQKRYGLGLYNGFNHVDVRPEGARWDYRR